MKPSEIYAILWNNVNRHYGATFQIVKNILNPKTGFMVSRAHREFSAPMPSHFTDFADLLEAYVKGFQDELTQNDVYLGLWYNESEGKLYFDVSERFETYEIAMTAGLNRKQLAIYDNEIRQVIWL